MTYPRYEQMVLPACELNIFPDFDIRNNWFNIVINITMRTPRQVRNFNIVLPGSSPKNQNQFLEELEEAHITEVWKCIVTPKGKVFTGVLAPCKETIENERLLVKIHKWNQDKPSRCAIYGKELPNHLEQDICLDCSTKEVLNKSRGLYE